MNLIFFGPPGSGKGTYASRLSEKLGIPHISTGQMFRDEIAKQTPLGKRITDNMNKGILTDDKTTNEMVRERLSRKDCKKGFILDGYPRTLNQGEFIDKIAKIDFVLDFVLDEKIILKKTLGRRVCKECGATYNVTDIKIGKISMPPLLPKKEGICDKCGGQIVQRPDDNEKTIKDRIKTYHKQSEPLLKFYKKKKLVVDVPVVGPPDVMVGLIINKIGVKK